MYPHYNWTRIPASGVTPPPDTCDNPTTILTHAFDSAGTGSPSQLLILGSTVKSYQAFSFVGGAIITDLHWTGGKTSVPEPFPITAWLIEVWNDNAGVPGTLAQTMVFSPALANETSIGTFGGVACFTYSVDFLPWFLADAGVTYWVSVQPNLQGPQQWLWMTGGAGSSYVILDGIGFANANALALDITGCVPT
jgi:hypothetical protein